MINFINEYSDAIFALLGAFGGGLISFFASWMIKKREFTLRLWDKLLDKRIKAHEDVITMALEMRIMVALGGFDENNEVLRVPKLLQSKEEFENWFRKFTQLTLNGSTWLTTETKREVNFVQDYLVTLHQYILQVPSEKYLSIGQIIRQDFIELSGELEKKAFNFFSKEIHQLELNNLNEHHKYKINDTKGRLNKTLLMTKWQSIKDIIDKN
ncbi:hypothetical protein [Poseidonibacter antarcticus]|uniref:hypothetical protein n=1 Tax=Poseidonibacter antarcticus TaxID=2478538 RepID=UPI000EF4869D|nr:hypothetical protein [Poseidonibacter antarcticus]